MRVRWVVGVLLLAVAGMPLCAAAQDGAVVRIQPATGTYGVGETFLVQVRIADVADLYGVDIRLAFDATRLQVVEAAVTPGTDLLSPPWWPFLNQVDNEAGTIAYVVTMINPQVPVSGSGVAFSFHFRTLGSGSAVTDVVERTLTDIDGMLIAATAAGATYQVGAPQHQVFLPLTLAVGRPAMAMEDGND